jgi:hypothetical protein
MHLTLKKEATKPAAGNFLQQQDRFDKFVEIFNHQRRHEALAMRSIGNTRRSSNSRTLSALAKNATAPQLCLRWLEWNTSGPMLLLVLWPFLDCRPYQTVEKRNSAHSVHGQHS